MPTLFFRAKEKWEAGHRHEAVAMLNDALAPMVGGPSFDLPDYLAESSNNPWFQTVVSILMTATHLMSTRSLLTAPFGSVWAALWKLDRYPHWIDVLLKYDFFVQPDSGPSDYEDHAPPANSVDDFERVCTVLEADARAGRLSNDDVDQPNGGRPVLTLAMIDAVDDARWGELKPMLRRRLDAAYRAAPKDPWAYRLGAEPEVVAVEALHDLFGRHGSSPAAAEPRWAAIRAAHPAYAAAARAALDKYARGADSAQLVETARIDAGLAVTDGMRWFAALLRALDDGNFAPLSSSV